MPVSVTGADGPKSTLFCFICVVFTHQFETGLKHDRCHKDPLGAGQNLSHHVNWGDLQIRKIALSNGASRRTRF